MRNLIYELNKVLVKQNGFIFIMLFIFIKLGVLFSLDNISVELKGESKTIYKDYLERLKGELTEDKKNFIKGEKEKIEKITLEKKQLANDYCNGKIEDEIYSLRMNEINNILKQADAFQVVNDQYEYIKENPKDRYFLYTTGWYNLLGNENLDMTLVFGLLIIITPIFTYEYEKDMMSLILTSKHGKRIVPIHKIIVATFISIIITSIFLMMDYLYFKFKYSLPYGNFPLKSLVYFKTSYYDISLIQAFKYISLIKVTGYLVFTYLIMFTAIVIRKTVLTLFTSLSFIVIPYIIYLNDSIKYKLPLPLGFMIGSGYFRGTIKADDIVNKTINFIEVSAYEFKLQFGYMAILATFFIFLAINKFSKFKTTSKNIWISK